MNVIEAATQLGLIIQQDERYAYLQAARQLNDTDEALQDLIGQFNLARIDLNANLNDPNRTPEKTKELEDKVNSVYAEVMQNNSMNAYNLAKGEVDKLMQHINAILSAAINGGDPTAVEDPANCTGNCNGCSSCG